MTNKSCYANLTEFKGILGVSATTDDTYMRKALEASSRYIDRYCHRHFYVESATKYLDGANVLWIPDLLSLTASGLQLDQDGNASFESTLASTDYIEYGIGNEDSLNSFPITRIEISEQSDYGGFATGIKKGVKIIGQWGFGDGYSSSPIIADTTLAASVSTGATASVTSATNLSPGMIILMDSEQAYINSVSSTALNLERGINGTTATTHANGTQIYYYRFPEDIRQACLDLSSAIWQNRGRKGISSERIGDYAYTLDKTIVNNILDDQIHHYKKMRF